jgi:predicted Fe-S protein YdhL (DUF1289 family)
MLKTVRTPCVGVCSTGIGDSVCRGCKRFEHEVINWNAYSNHQKRAIDERLARILSNVVAGYLIVNSPQLLEQQLKLQQIRYADWRDPNCWLFELLRAGATQLTSYEQYGFSLRPSSRDLSLVDIRERIESEVYQLSIAHFERYIVANQVKAVTVSE